MGECGGVVCCEGGGRIGVEESGLPVGLESGGL